MTFLNRWWAALRGEKRSSRNRARRSRPQTTLRPQLELLEDRTLLDTGFGSVFTSFVNLGNRTQEPALTSAIQPSKSGNAIVVNNPLAIEQQALHQVSNEIHQVLFGSFQLPQTETTTTDKSWEGGTFGVHHAQSGTEASSPLSLAAYAKYGSEGTVPSKTEQWIELNSFEWGSGRSSTEGETLSHVPQASTITFPDKTGYDKTGSYTPPDVGISGYSASGSLDRPQESLSLNFTKISEVSDTTHDKTGPTGTVTYDRTQQSQS